MTLEVFSILKDSMIRSEEILTKLRRGLSRELKQKVQTVSPSKLSWGTLSVGCTPSFPGPAGRRQALCHHFLQTLEKSRQSTIPFTEITPNLLF